MFTEEAPIITDVGRNHSGSDNEVGKKSMSKSIAAVREKAEK